MTDTIAYIDRLRMDVASAQSRATTAERQRTEAIAHAEKAYEQGWEEGRADMHDGFAIANAERDRYRAVVEAAKRVQALDARRCALADELPNFDDPADLVSDLIGIDGIKVATVHAQQNLTEALAALSKEEQP